MSSVIEGESGDLYAGTIRFVNECLQWESLHSDIWEPVIKAVLTTGDVVEIQNK